MEPTVTPVPEGPLPFVEYGDPLGVPVVMLHGMPGTKSGPLPRGVVFRRLGVRLIAYDRPGYGQAPRRRGRTVVDAAEDVRQLADALELKRFAVLGRSGGAPHALAVAAKLGSSTVTAVAALVSLAPYRGLCGMGEKWWEGMTSGNREIYGLEPDELDERLSELAQKSWAEPEAILEALVNSNLTRADRRVVGEETIRGQLRRTYQEAVPFGRHDGWYDDVVALRSEWGFDPRVIAVPTLLWHGELDEFSPVAHTRWLAGHLPGATMWLDSEVGHFGAMEILPRVVRWLADRHEGVPDGAEPFRSRAGERAAAASERVVRIEEPRHEPAVAQLADHRMVESQPGGQRSQGMVVARNPGARTVG